MQIRDYAINATITHITTTADGGTWADGHTRGDCAGRGGKPVTHRFALAAPVQFEKAVADCELQGLNLWPCAACIPLGDAKLSTQDDRPDPTPGDGGCRPARTHGVEDDAWTGKVAADVEAWLLKLDRKVDVVEVTTALAKLATAWAKAWTGDFAFMVDMKDAATNRRTGLSVGQAKGVLNCWRADLNRRPKAAPAASATPAAVADGYEPKKGDVHIIDGVYYRVHISQSAGFAYPAVWSDDEGAFVAGRIDPRAKGKLAQFSTATMATAEQAKAFGKMSHRCCFCSVPIDTPESEAAGYGPKCAADRNLPWGTRAVVA